MISRIVERNRLSFIFHKYLVEHSDSVDKKLADYKFLKEISAIDYEKFYDELE